MGAHVPGVELPVAVDGYSTSFYKIGTAPEAAGQFYCFSKDSGRPGAWAPGAPGVNGRATDGTTVADAGSLPIPQPAAGAHWLRSLAAAATVACYLMLIDVLWVNSGLDVTSTSAQPIVPVAIPARDNNGSSNGVGVLPALLVTAATGAAAATVTLSYTNQDGTAGRAATATYPASLNIGMLVPFLLQAGDTGVRSVESVTFSASVLSGSVSLVLYREVVGLPLTLVNAGSLTQVGARLWVGACLLFASLASATTATTITGTVVTEVA